jgi:hypothetical protein
MRRLAVNNTIRVKQLRVASHEVAVQLRGAVTTLPTSEATKRQGMTRRPNTPETVR